MPTSPPKAPGREYFLHPGDVVCAGRGDRLDTLLGSCVAAILTDQHRTVAAMCHVVYCEHSQGGLAATTKGANAAVDRMYELLREHGMNPSMCDAYVYGGGNMFPELIDGTGVGRNNALCVIRRLRRDHLQMRAEDLGGTAYRRLRWRVGEGEPQVEAVEVVQT